jgi:hypothetical protein
MEFLVFGILIAIFIYFFMQINKLNGKIGKLGKSLEFLNERCNLSVSSGPLFQNSRDSQNPEDEDIVETIRHVRGAREHRILPAQNITFNSSTEDMVTFFNGVLGKIKKLVEE